MMRRALLAIFAVLVVVVGSNCGSDGGTPDGGNPDVIVGPCGVGTLAQCSGTCTDLQSDYQNCGACGNACPIDKVCSHGACATVCGGGTARCGNNCVDLKADPNNCGGCNSKCPTGNVCNGSKCALTCQTGLSDCNGGCIDLTSD